MTWVLVIFFVQGWNSASVTNVPGYKTGEECYKAEKEIIEFTGNMGGFGNPRFVIAYCITGPSL